MDALAIPDLMGKLSTVAAYIPCAILVSSASAAMSSKMLESIRSVALGRSPERVPEAAMKSMMASGAPASWR